MRQAAPSAFRVDGTALVIGAGSKIGAATAAALSLAGAHVIVADIRQDAAASVASALTRATAVALEVTSEADILKSVETSPALNVLVNKAGIGLVGDIVATSAPDFERVMMMNSTSVYLVTRACLPLLLASQGSVINIASVPGFIGVKRRFAYSASKGAVVATTRQLAVDYPSALRVNCICPGTVHSPFVADHLAKYRHGEEEQVREQLKQRQPVGRLGRPDEVASFVRGLCSPAANFVHGSILTIGGGWTAA